METKSNILNYLMKHFGKGIFYGTSIIVVGYIAYILKNKKMVISKKNEQANNSSESSTISPIPTQQLEKILIKVNNRLFILLANLLDYSQNHEEKSDKSAEENKNYSEIYLKTESDSGYSTRRNSYIQRLLGTKQIYEQIMNEEIQIVKNHGYTKEQYVYSIQNNDSMDITKHIEFLVNFRRNIEQNQLMEIDFGELFLKNYLKIISNIYFINLKKVQESFKLNYVHRKFFFKNYCHLNDVLIKLYSDFLKETRNEVCEYFGIKNDKLLDVKVLLRLYYYYLKPTDEARIKMDEYVQILNDVLANLSWGLEFPILEKSSGKPKDEVIELSSILLCKVEYNERLETDNSIPDYNINKEEFLKTR